MDTLNRVDGKPFVGRTEEQEQFRRIINRIIKDNRWFLLPRRADETADWSHIILLHGPGGIGKTSLCKRFRDIALGTHPDQHFRGKFRVIWWDWGSRQDPRLATPELVTLDTALDHLYATFRDVGFARGFTDFIRVRKQQNEVLAKVDKALRLTGEEKDLYPTFRKLGAQGLALLLRTGVAAGALLPQDKVSEVFAELVDGGARGLETLRRQADEWARRSLKREDYELFALPHEALARSFAKGVRLASEVNPIILIQDMYEIVDYVDPLLRLVFEHAGPLTLWVLSGRNDLTQKQRFGQLPLLDYRETVPSTRLSVFSLHELGHSELVQYFAESVPDRSLGLNESSLIHNATFGIPLAMKHAAAMWARGGTIETITEGIPQGTDLESVVNTMTERVLIHAKRDPKHPEDVFRIYMLAIAYQPDYDILSALWDSAEAPAILEDLHQRYDFVSFQGMRLLPTIQKFIRDYLLSEVERGNPRFRDANERAVAVLEERLKTQSRSFSTLDDRLAHEHWVADVRALIWHRFWLDEELGWATVLSIIPAGFVYSRPFGHAVLEVARFFQPVWTKTKRHYLELLQTGLSPLADDPPAPVVAILNSERVPNMFQPDDDCEAETSAILALLRVAVTMEEKRYQEALTVLQEVAYQIPKKADTLRVLLVGTILQLVNTIADLEMSDGPSGLELANKAVELAMMLAPENSDVWATRGAVYREQKRFEESISAYLTAQKLDPQDSHPWHGLAHTYKDMHRFDEALNAFQEAINRNPDNSDHWRCMGDLYLDTRGQVAFEEAFGHYQRALTLSPSNAHAWHGLAHLYIEQHKHKEAIAALQKAVLLDPYGNHWRMLVNVYVDGNRLEEAITACKQASTRQGTDGWPWHELGHIYAKQGHLKEAVKAFRQATRRDRTEVSHWYCLGDLLEEEGSLDKAIDAYQRAVAIDPQVAEYWRALGSLQMAQGDKKAAMETYLQAIAHQVTDSAIWISLGERYEEQGNAAKAQEAYQQAIAIDPNSAWALHHLAHFLISENRVNEAIQAFNEAMKNDPQSFDHRLGLARAYYDADELESALETLRPAIDTHPQNPQLWNGLGTVYWTQGRIQESIEAFDQATKLDPTGGANWHRLGVAFLEQHDWARAEIALSKAREFADPNNYQPFIDSALLRCRQRRYLEAWQFLHDALAHCTGGTANSQIAYAWLRAITQEQPKNLSMLKRELKKDKQRNTVISDLVRVTDALAEAPKVPTVVEEVRRLLNVKISSTKE